MIKIALNELGRRIGEGHPNARYTDNEVRMVLILRAEGLGWKRMSAKLEIPIRTLRSICSGARRNQVPTQWRTK